MYGTLQILITSILLGAFVGFQREKSIRVHGYHSFAGLRTSTFICLLGSLTTILNDRFDYLLPIVLAVFGALLVSTYVYSAFVEKKAGGTGEFVLLTLFLVGVLTAIGQMILAIVLVIFIGFVESCKYKLHELTDVFSEEEFLDTLKFAAIAFVVLPLLPNYAIDPFGIINPYMVWLMVVFISGISFVAYIAGKFVGEKKGIALAGFFGGLISSTAVTTTMSAANKEKPKVVSPFAFAIVVASGMMFVRVLIEVLVLNPILLSQLIVPLGVMIAVSGLIAYYFWTHDGGFREKRAKSHTHIEDVGLESPFMISPALKFAVFFMVILAVVKFSGDYFGDSGVYLTAFVSGFADVDAITLSLSNLSRDGVIESSVAVTGITIAVLMNTAMKLLYVKLFGGSVLTWRMFAAFSLILGSGILALLFV